MKVVLDRGFCDATLEYCQRCSAALIRHPEGLDRPCILDIVDDGKESLTLEMFTEGRHLEIDLTKEQRDLASVEGWEALGDFDPALFREGALERWHEIRLLPATH